MWSHNPESFICIQSTHISRIGLGFSSEFCIDISFKYLGSYWNNYYLPEPNKYRSSVKQRANEGNRIILSGKKIYYMDIPVV